MTLTNASKEDEILFNEVKNFVDQNCNFYVINENNGKHCITIPRYSGKIYILISEESSYVTYEITRNDMDEDMDEIYGLVKDLDEKFF